MINHAKLIKEYEAFTGVQNATNKGPVLRTLEEMLEYRCKDLAFWASRKTPSKEALDNYDAEAVQLALFCSRTFQENLESTYKTFPTHMPRIKARVAELVTPGVWQSIITWPV